MPGRASMHIGRGMPVAAKQLHVGAARRCGDGAVDPFVAVDLAGEQRLHAGRVVLHAEDVDLEPFPLAKPRFAAIKKKPASALGMIMA